MKSCGSEACRPTWGRPHPFGKLRTGLTLSRRERELLKDPVSRGRPAPLQTHDSPLDFSPLSNGGVLEIMRRTWRKARCRLAFPVSPDSPEYSSFPF